jgi:hypothetical protein
MVPFQFTFIFQLGFALIFSRWCGFCDTHNLFMACAEWRDWLGLVMKIDGKFRTIMDMNLNKWFLHLIFIRKHLNVESSEIFHPFFWGIFDEGVKREMGNLRIYNVKEGKWEWRVNRKWFLNSFNKRPCVCEILRVCRQKEELSGHGRSFKWTAKFRKLHSNNSSNLYQTFSTLTKLIPTLIFLNIQEACRHLHYIQIAQKFP